MFRRNLKLFRKIREDFSINTKCSKRRDLQLYKTFKKNSLSSKMSNGTPTYQFSKLTSNSAKYFSITLNYTKYSKEVSVKIFQRKTSVY